MDGDRRRSIPLGDGKQYIIGDAITELSSIDDADVIHLDDAWARPHRGGQFGVDYPTHPFEDEEESSISTKRVVDACMSSLKEGGWLIADVDDWLHPRLLRHLTERYGDVNEDYSGGGYRKVGSVTYTSSDGTPDKSTPGMYLSTGGYSVIFAHKGETDRTTSASARQITPRQRDKFGWGSVKPIGPYRAWLSGLLRPGDHLVVPCAGTAPAALAAETEFGENIRYTCIDTEPGAYRAFSHRAQEELNYSDGDELELPSVPSQSAD